MMRNPDADEARRDRMAVAAAPYVHERTVAADARVGKKEQALARAQQFNTQTTIGKLMAKRHGLVPGGDSVN